MTRVTVSLRTDEKEALKTLARLERRDPRAQAAILIRQSLERLGLLEPTAPQREVQQYVSR